MRWLSTTRVTSECIFKFQKKKNQMSLNSLYVIVCVTVVFVWGSLLYARVLVFEIWDTYILLDVLLCSIAEYFYELCRILASPQGESKYKQRVKILSDTTQKTSNKRFIIQHAKLVCSCERISWIFIFRECVGDRSMLSGTDLAREIKLTDWSMAGNLSNRSSGVQIPRDICTGLKRYLYSAKCSWIINSFLSVPFHLIAFSFCVSLLLPAKASVFVP